jgi:hypothetical protein
MLQLSPEYPLRLPELMQALSGGVSHESAFRKIYGKSIREIQKDLERYIRGDQFALGFVKARLRQRSLPVEARGAAADESLAVLADLRAFV